MSFDIKKRKIKEKKGGEEEKGALLQQCRNKVSNKLVSCYILKAV
ncbi:hypothetical protein ACMBCN_01615 [Candidatus Liberibacter asiaticus]